jgi:hypothetical protein
MTCRLAAVGAVVAAVVCGAAVQPVTAQRPTATEYEVKAAYILSFGKFVQWPAGARRSAPTFELCVIGPDPFGSALDRVVAGSTVGGRGVQARRISDAADAGGCHVLFVGSESRQVPELLASLLPDDVLTVGDGADFLERGGMIRFVTRDGRVRFEVNLTKAQAAGLVLSSDLLRVASNVQRERRP